MPRNDESLFMTYQIVEKIGDFMPTPSKVIISAKQRGETYQFVQPNILYGKEFKEDFDFIWFLNDEILNNIDSTAGRVGNIKTIIYVLIHKMMNMIDKFR